MRKEAFESLNIEAPVGLPGVGEFGWGGGGGVRDVCCW